MNATTLALVLAGAVCHALWNILAKRTAGGLVFVWLFGCVSLAAAAPVALWACGLARRPSTPGCGWPH